MSTANPFATPPQAGSSAPASPFTNGAASAVPDEASLAGATEETAKPALPEIDLDDPGLISETLTAQEGDAFAEPPPPPDRIYRVQLKLRGVTAQDYGRDITKWSGGAEVAPWVPEIQVDKKTGQNVGTYVKTKIDIRIHDPKYPEFEGIYLQLPFGGWIDSRAGRNNGPSKMMTLLMLLRQPSGQPWLEKGKNYGPKVMVETFVKALAGEPELRCQSEWTWSCQLCGEAAKKSGGRYPNPIEGMNKFNMVPGKAGVYNHEMRCPAIPAHGFSKARAQAAQFFALDDAGKK